MSDDIHDIREELLDKEFPSQWNGLKSSFNEFCKNAKMIRRTGAWSTFGKCDSWAEYCEKMLGEHYAFIDGLIDAYLEEDERKHSQGILSPDSSHLNDGGSPE